MFMQLFFFLKFTQRATVLQTVSKQEVTLKRLISMLRIAQKLNVGAGKNHASKSFRKTFTLIHICLFDLIL